MKLNMYLGVIFFICITFVRSDTNYYAGVGIADITGPAAEVNMVSLIRVILIVLDSRSVTKYLINLFMVNRTSRSEGAEPVTVTVARACAWRTNGSSRVKIR